MSDASQTPLGPSLPGAAPTLLAALVGALAVAVATPSPGHAQDRGESQEEALPLEASRAARIDLDEGTWISVDVSPDGGTLVFDYLGDLFTLPITGGTATQLTRGMAVDAQPRFSPDGEWVAFTSDRSGGQNVWIMRVDGSDTVQISEGKANRAESPEWTPDGEYLVASMGDFRASDLPKLHLFHVEGGSGTKLIDEPERLKTLGAAFGDDDRWIWFARRTGDWEYNAQLPQYQLAVYDRDTGKTYTRSSRQGSAFRPTLSPDGRWLVYGTRWEDRTGLMLRDLRNGDERWLAYPVQHDDQESRATFDVLPGMSFTPDSRALVASYGGKLWRIPVEEGADAEPIPFRVAFDLDIGPEVDFDYPVEDTPTFTVRQVRGAVPSPDGRRLAFAAMDRLWVAGADGSNPRQVTGSTATESFPAWSPDGRWLAYSTWEDGVGALYKVPSDGSGDPVRLTERNAVWLSPAWNPAGDRIVALRGVARAYRESSSPQAAQGAGDELVWVPAEGGPATLIMPTESRIAPHFVTDRPDRIYLYRAEDERLVSVRWDGTDEKEHVRVRGGTPAGYDDPLEPGVVLMAPRGDQALAMIQNHLYTVTVPRTGGDVPTISVANPENAAFPARKLTEVGAEFPAWGADGRTVHWSLGNAHFVYDLDAAWAFDDSLEAAGGEEAGDEEAEADDRPRYRPAEHRIVIEAERDVPRGTAVLRGARIVTMV
ncbi:MAG: amidohydrolase, partial [Gemmatimonadota bacterium]